MTENYDISKQDFPDAGKLAIDNIDAQILTLLQRDSRIPFQEIARKIHVSGGTVHVRVKKMKAAGIIKGSKIIVDYNKLNFDVSAFIGINLVTAGSSAKIIKALKEMPEVLEAHYTTGKYSLFIKVMVENTTALHLFLQEKLQKIKGISSTETIMSLHTPINRGPEF